jgi:3-oxoacyl-[acyl-carrier-protein] synthase-3
MSESSAGLLDRVGWGADDLDWCVGHQANLRILHMVADVLGVPHQRLLVNIDRVGNTSAASIPLALHDAVASGQLSGGDRVLMTTFGGGLSWGSAAVTWPRLPGFHPAA